MKPEERIHQYLEFLYGEETAQDVHKKIIRIIEESRQKLIARKSIKGRQLSERDAILITYGDQLNEEHHRIFDSTIYFQDKLDPVFFVFACDQLSLFPSCNRRWSSRSPTANLPTDNSPRGSYNPTIALKITSADNPRFSTVCARGLDKFHPFIPSRYSTYAGDYSK